MSWNCRFVLKIGLLVATALASTYGYAVDGKIEGCPVVVRQAAMVGPVTSVKVAVTSEAVYRVSAAQMASAFSKTGAEITNALLAGQVRVANRGQVVPSECSLEGVSFYGVGLVTRYSTENVYWITLEPGQAPALLSVGGASETLGQSIPWTAFFEGYDNPRTDLALNENDDPWFWKHLSPGGSLSTTFSKTFSLSPPTAFDTLSVRIKGSFETGSNAVSVSLNGKILGTNVLWGLEHPTWVFSAAAVPPAVSCVVTVKLLSTVNAQVYVDDFSLAYRRALTAVSNQMVYTVAGPGPWTIGGFTDPDIEILEVTDGRGWRRVSGATLSGVPGDYRASFLAPGPGRYLAVTNGLRRAPVSVVADGPSDLKAIANGADYLVITVPTFDTVADALVAYRAAQDLQARKTYMEDIYDEFNCGIKDPQAIRAFLGYAYRMWNRAPRYVAILGEGSVDYRNFKGDNDCIVPPMIKAGISGQFGSDTPLGDLDGDGVPEFAIGRLPILTVEEGLAVLAKIQAYETGGAWKTQALGVADIHTFNSNYTASLDLLLPALGAMPKTLVYAETNGIPQSKIDVIETLNSGCGILAYIGEASMSYIGCFYAAAGEHILESGDLQTNLVNQSTPPLIVGLTCIVGVFGMIGGDSLGEQMVVSSNGAAAFWSSSTWEHDDGKLVAGQWLLSNLYVHGVARVGDGILAAMAEGKAAGRGEAFLGFNLLGDPALAVGDPNSTRIGDPTPDGQPPYSEWQRWAIAPAVNDIGISTGPNDDLDGDGMSNDGERLAGTDPSDAESFLAFNQAVPGPSAGTMVVQWSSAPRRDYILESVSAVTGLYGVVNADLPGTAPLNSQTNVLGDEKAMIYRVLVK